MSICFYNGGGGVIGVLGEGAKRPSGGGGGGCARGEPPPTVGNFFQKLEYQNSILEHFKTKF